MSASAAQLDITTLDWGNPKAESDSVLERAFVEVDGSNLLLSGSKSLVVGPRGAGKTAIVLRLQNRLTDGGALSVLIQPVQFIYSGLSELENVSESQRNLIAQSSWINLICTKIVEQYAETLSGKPILTGLDHRIREIAKEQGTSTQDPIEYFSYLVKKILPKVTKVEIGKVGKVELDSESVRRETNEKELRSLAAHVARQTSLWVFIDDLDWCWDGTAASTSVLVGLMLAKASLERDKVRIVLALRSEIYRLLLRTPNFGTKQVDNLDIEWDEDSLKTLLVLRIRANCDMQGVRHKNLSDPEVFRKVFPSDVSGENTTRYLGRLSGNNPRALIRIVSDYTQELRRAKLTTPDRATLKDREWEFARRHLEQTLTDHSAFLPELADATPALIGGKINLTSATKIADLKLQLQGIAYRSGILSDQSADALIDQLCLAGIIGHAMDSGGPWFWEPTDLKQSDYVKVSGQFRSAFRKSGKK